MDEAVPQIREDVADGTPKPPNEAYGPNNEQLPEDLQSALKRLVHACELEDDSARRAEVLRIEKARLFWRGLQNIAYDEQAKAWVMPNDVHGLLPDLASDDETYDCITNIFRPIGRTFIATLSQQPPKVRFSPQDADQPADVATSTEASKVVRLFHKNNKIRQLLKKVGHLAWTDGTVGFYTRYVVDGERFGYKTIPIMGEEVREMPGPTPDGLPIQVSVPVQVGEEKVPNGREVVDVVGKLGLKIPVNAESERDYGYLTWASEIHRSKIKALYPHVADKLGQQAAGESDTMERNTRARIASGSESAGSAGEDPVTFKRTWLRPWTFYGLKDRTQTDQLLKLFPKGIYVAFAGETYCEARNENLDAYWTVWHAMEGEGTIREGAGHDLIGVQERVNTLSNIITDSFEHSIGTTFFDEQIVDRDAWKNAPPVPGSKIPVRRAGLASLKDGFFTDMGTPLNPQIILHLQELVGPVAQLVTGIYPALSGGGGINTDTYKGLELQRQQSQGQIGSIYESFVDAWHNVALQAVECFRDNRPEDVKFSVQGPSGRFESELIRLDDLSGNLEASPEEDQGLPTSQVERRHVLTELLNGQVPEMSTYMLQPSNFDLVTKALGMPELKVPGSDARKKQYREIRELLKGVPVQTMVEVMDPMTGAMVQQPQTQSTIPIDELLDDHATEFAAIQEFANSDEGQLAKLENPLGWENVKAHAMAHYAILQQQMMAQQQAEMAAKQPPPKEAPAN